MADAPRPTAPFGRGSALLSMISKLRVESANPGRPDLDPSVTATDLPPIKEEASSEVTKDAESVKTTSEDVKTSPEVVKLSSNPAVREPPVVKMGTAGGKVQLSTNFVEIRMEDGRGIFQYIVTMEPAVDDIRARYRKLYSEVGLLTSARMFDGTRLILPNRLQEDKMSFENDGTKITIAFDRELEIYEPQCVRMCNYTLNQVFRILKLCPIKTGVEKCFYSPENKKEIRQHRLEVWPGYTFTVNEYESGVMMQVDTSSKIVRQEHVLSIIRDLARKDPKNYQELAIKELVGKNIITRYNNRTYRLDEIDFTQSPSNTFEGTNGAITFIDYFKKAYDIDIQDKQQPLIIHQIKRKEGEEPLRIGLIPELCYITGLSEDMRANYKIVKDVAEFTRHSPMTRHEVITKLLNSIHENREAREFLQTWGICLEKKTAMAEGRSMPQATLTFGGNYTEKIGPKGDWNKAATTKTVLSAIDIKTWSIIFPQSIESDAKKFCSTLLTQAQRLGININRPNVIPINTDRVDAFLTALRSMPEDTQLALTMCGGGQRSDRYSAIKKYCYMEKPLASQVVMQKTISNEKRLTAVCQKIALQMNCKMGGSLWSTKLPFAGLMIVGIDIYREKAGGSTGGRMVAGVVSSLSDQHIKFYSQVVLELGKDLHAGISKAIEKAVNKFRDSNQGHGPKHVLIYRDGVNSGLLESTLDEAKKLDKHLKSLDGMTESAFTYVIVQKKHNTKIFQNISGAFSNPPAGVVLDNYVTRRNWYDFYVVPMNVAFGTVTPTHFTVVFDESALTPDQLQRISYVMTFLYYNWPGNVKVPAHCQYAHKLVELVGEFLHAAPHESLADKLYYL